MAKLFISYRREDSLDISGRIYDRLAGHFGLDSVFMDVDTIPYGVDFRHYLAGWVSGCDILLVVIGKNWLDVRHHDGPLAGRRRLDDPSDFVRIEVAAALARGIFVLPVLVGGASIPAPDQLPADLSDLAYRNAAEVRSGRDFHGHMNRLIAGLERLLKPAPDVKPPAKPKPAPPPRRITTFRPPAQVEPPEVSWPTNLGFDGPDVEGVPFGWFNSLGFVGGVSIEYEVRVVDRKGDGEGRCVRIRRAGARPKEFGSLMQRCPAQNFLGKVVRLEGELRAENLAAWAGLWLRVDGPSRHLFFDNMHDRPLRGSPPWGRYSLETVVPEGAEWLNYGILLVGDGTLWADNFSLGVRDVGSPA
jgi:hypothetical protein